MEIFRSDNFAQFAACGKFHSNKRLLIAVLNGVNGSDIRMVESAGGSKNAAPFPSAIIVFGPLDLFKNKGIVKQVLL